MRLMSYIRKHAKTGIYWYRRAVPLRLREHLPPITGFAARVRTEITKSLETRDLRTANRMAGEIDRRVQAALDQAQAVIARPQPQPVTAAARTYSRGDLETAIENWRRAETARLETEIINNPPPANPARTALAEAAAHANRNHALAEGRCDDVPGFYAAMASALATQGIGIAADHPALRRLGPTYAAAWYDTIRARERYLLGLPLDEPASVPAAPAAPPAPNQPPDPKAERPFLVALAQWEQDMPYRGRQVSTYLSDVRSYAAVIADGPISAVDYDSIQRWISEIQATVTAKTAKRKLSALASYWRYLQHKGHVPRGDFPGRGVTILRDPTSPADRRRSFAPAEVVRLWQMAASEGDHVLADAIKLAAYTGARIESLFQIKISDVGEIDGIPLVRLHDKTEAGRRSVPVHTAIRPLVARLCTSPQPGGYLLPGHANRHGERAAAAGKRFARMRTRAGFGAQHVFHSIRKTVASMLRVAGVDEADTAQLLGHEYRSMSYGIYADDLVVPHLAPIIEPAIRYPEAP